MRGPFFDPLAVKSYRAAGDRLHTGNGVHQRRLAGAIGADQSDDLSGVDMERDAVQNFDAAIGAFDIFNRKHARPPASREHPNKPRSPPRWTALVAECLPRAFCLWPGHERGRRYSSPDAYRARPTPP